jgi:hypothetical protein
MTERTTDELSPESFPFPKIIQTFNYFFPKEKGAPEIFTMANLRKFARIAPYLTLGIFGLLIASWARDCFHAFGSVKNPPAKWGIYLLFDSLLFLIVLVQYVWWLGAALFAKLFKRSPTIPLALSFLDPIRIAVGGFLIFHFIGFLMGGMCDFQPTFHKKSHSSETIGKVKN